MASRRRNAGFAKARPVTITHTDGSREVRQPYTEAELARIDRKARRQPRTWDEINSRAGGGADGTFVT